MNYNKKFKTPTLKPMRLNSGTLYTFSSALEDVGLNINERNNIVKLSNYAVLNIPSSISTKLPYKGTYEKNNFNFHNSLGFYAYINGMISNTNNFVTLDGKSALPLSLQSYALNLETAILTSDEYDPTTSLTISERVFWKWLKESGAIRWENRNGVIHEESNSDDYNSVVKAIGEITASSFKINSFGNFNEVLIQLPTSFGDTPVKFSQIEDNNYYFTKQINIVDENPNLIIGKETEDNINIPCVAFYDYINSVTNVTNSAISQKGELYFSNDGAENFENRGWWYTPQNINPIKNYSYIIDTDILSNGYTENTYLRIGDKIIKRSNYDCMSVNFDINSYSEYEVGTFDELATLLSANGYEFNAILVYYSVYNSTNDSKLATNLLGVLFLDSPTGAISSEMQDISTEMSIKTLEKFKSNTLGTDNKIISEFGNSFNFRISLQSNSIKDDTVAYIEDTTSINYLDDFTKVFANLNQAVNILGKQTKNIFTLNEQYLESKNILNRQSKKLDILEQTINGVINKLNIDILGTTTPTIKIGKNIAKDAILSSNSTIIGYNSCYKTKSLNNTVSIGTSSGYNCEENNNNIFIGYKAGFNERDSYKLHIESNDKFTDAPLIYGNFHEDNRSLIFNANNIHIPNLNNMGSGVALTWDNGIIKLATSSSKFKENIKDLTINNILELNPKSFNYINDNNKQLCYGLIAEEVEMIDKNLIVYGDNNEIIGIKYDMLSVLLIDELKKLKNKIINLENKLN